MNLTRVLQPYVCCLGNPVAGNPTQFVMYRAARAAGVDWRFFTSQVEAEQFEVAFRGVQALGLSGMALFEPFQAAALKLLDSVTESAICLGGVNVARLDGNSWLGDNTLGTAIMNCIKPILTSPSSQQTAEGVGAVTAEPTCILVLGASKIAKAMRLANADLAGRVLAVDEGLNAEVAEPTFNDWELMSLDAFLQRDMNVDCLIQERLPSAAVTRQLGSLKWGSNPTCLLLGNASDKQRRLWQDSLKVSGMACIEPIELMSHQAAADFFFWTGIEPSMELIRDSLEEYLQW